jgi:hypothetical protein
MKNSRPFTAVDVGAAEQKCFVCGKEITDGWFCRIPRDGGRIVLCSPSCAMRFFENSFSTAHERVLSNPLNLLAQPI